MTTLGTRSGRLVIAVGFATAIAIAPVAAALSSEQTPRGSERSVAGCLPFTEICWPDPPSPTPVEGTPAASGMPAPSATTAPVPPSQLPVDQITINGKETLINGGPS